MKRLLVLIAAAVLPACYCGTNPYYYDYAYYDPYYYAYDSAYVYGTYDPYGIYYDSERSPQTVDLSAAAQAIAARAGENFSPSKCVTATANGANVNYVLDDCEGRFGGKNIKGRIDVALSQEGDQLRFAASSRDLRIDGDDFILDVKGAATAAGSQRVVTIDSKSRATHKVDSRTSTGTITWEQGNPCLTINAQGSSTKDENTLSSTITNFTKCAGKCPSGGSMTVNGSEGTYSGSFDGSDTLRINAPNGNDKSFGLQCK